MSVETADRALEALAERGWAVLEVDNDVPLHQVADGLLGKGDVERSRLTALVPRAQQDAKPFSLSSSFGLGAMEAHTDGATEAVPPRWCFLRTAPGALTRTPTVFWDIRALDLPAAQLDVLRRAMWVVRGGSRTFYTSVLRRHGNEEIVRFNRVCMRPIGPAGAQAGEKLATTLLLSAPTEHRWKSGEVPCPRQLAASPLAACGDHR
jgi:hypothetical protein